MDYVAKAVREAELLMQPHLLAIYSDDAAVSNGGQPVQIGTGFLVSSTKLPVLITAEHTLYGHDGTQDPTKKLIFANNNLSRFDTLQVQFKRTGSFDVVAIHGLNLPGKPLLPPTAWRPGGSTPRVLTVIGYLARDFHRSAAGGMLRPQPFAFTNRSTGLRNGRLAMEYPHHRVVGTFSGRKVQAPIPQGLSGGPILDTLGLLQRRLILLGIFTEQPEFTGMAYGEPASKIVDLL